MQGHFYLLSQNPRLSSCAPVARLLLLAFETHHNIALSCLLVSVNWEIFFSVQRLMMRNIVKLFADILVFRMFRLQAFSHDAAYCYPSRGVPRDVSHSNPQLHVDRGDVYMFVTLCLIVK